MHKLLFTTLLLATSAISVHANELSSVSELKLANKILHFLDKGKANGKPFELTMSIENLKSNKRQTFKMKDDGESNTVLEFLDKRQRGQKILSTENDIWFFSKRTRRAIKIPPIQRLFGDASIGDISRLRYSLDYVPIGLSKENDLIKLSLKSNSPASTYHSVELWVKETTHLPHKAKLYAASGKLLKSALFIDVELIDDTPVINRWQLSTAQDANKITQVTSANFNYIKANAIEFTKSYLELNK